jgi:hypothetical protein
MLVGDNNNDGRGIILCVGIPCNVYPTLCSDQTAVVAASSSSNSQQYDEFVSNDDGRSPCWFFFLACFVGR